MKINCNVCKSLLKKKIYDSLINKSITSLSKIINFRTKVFICDNCQHIQTSTMPNEFLYYDNNYKILLDSEEEDQIYTINNNKIIYRNQHQAKLLLKKIYISSSKKILDYGCGKASTMHEIKKLNHSISPFLFDISKDYVKYWNNFVSKNNRAIYKLPKKWMGNFDLVTSFFALEHITKLNETLENIKKTLVQGGLFYAIVPNTFTNPGDLIVADHPNHFTINSLKYIFSKIGFNLIEIDETSHNGAYIVIAENTLTSKQKLSKDRTLKKKTLRLGKFWSSTAKRIRKFEKKLPKTSKSVVYGAGFYGTFLASSLINHKKIICFLDQNKFLNGKTILGKPIIFPSKLPKCIDSIYVALNPKNSRKIINSSKSFTSKKLKFFYI